MADEKDKKTDVTNAEPVKDKTPPTPAPAPATPPAPAPVENKKPLSLDEYLATVPADVREMVSNGLNLLSQKKADLIKTITNAKGNVFTAEELNSKSVVDLEKMSALIPKAEFVGNAGTPQIDNSSGLTPLALPTWDTMLPKPVSK